MIADATLHDKILIVDDERGPRESLRFLLKNDYAVHCAESVDRGVEWLRDERPELVVMDIRMPGKDGIEGLFEVRKLDKQVSVVMLTGYGTLETAQQALRLGANDYLNKPFEADEMRQIVRRYVQRTKLERKRAAVLVELEEMNNSLMHDLAEKERMAQVGQSSAELVHDMRNPLMIVTGYVDLLSRELEKAKEMVGGEYGHTAEYLDVIAQNVRRCNDLAHSWQKFRKADMAKLAPTALKAVMDDLMAGVDLLAFAESVDIACAEVSAEFVVNGNHGQLIRALHNVISNAIHAVSPGVGQIRITCRPEGDAVAIAVQDNGRGMTPEVMSRMFEPYFTTKSQTKGTGLGLSITKRIVEEHNGSIRVESKPGQGTTVTILLPLLKQTAAAPAAAGQSA